MANEQEQLTAQLSNINIGSLDDTLSRKLQNTHLVKASTTSYTATNEPTTPWPSAVLHRPTSDQPSWQTASQPSTTSDDQDDWGDAPAYTSLLPYTEFGFTSNIVPSLASIPSSAMKKDTLTLDPNQPFCRYSQQRNGFASFASLPPAPQHLNNNASTF